MSKIARGMQQAAAGAAGGGFEDVYKMVEIGTTSYRESAIDPNTGDVYYLWTEGPSGNNTGFSVVKVALDGTQAWYKQYSNSKNISRAQSAGGSRSNSYGHTLRLDGNGDVYVAVTFALTGGTYEDAYTGTLFKISRSDGSLLWHRSRQYASANHGSQSVSNWVSTTQNDNYVGNPHIVCDTDSNDVYMLINANSYDDGLRRYYLYKFNSSGTLQWQRRIYPSSGTIDFTNSHFTSSFYKNGHIYFTGSIRLSNTYTNWWHITALKINTSTLAVDTPFWLKTAGGDYSPFSDMVVDDSGNYYIAANRQQAWPTIASSSGYNAMFVKLNSSGVKQWEADYNAPLSAEQAVGVFYDEENDKVIGLANSDQYYYGSWDNYPDGMAIMQMNGTDGDATSLYTVNFKNEARDWSTHWFKGAGQTIVATGIFAGNPQRTFSIVWPFGTTLATNYNTATTGFGGTIYSQSLSASSYTSQNYHGTSDVTSDIDVDLDLTSNITSGNHYYTFSTANNSVTVTDKNSDTSKVKIYVHS